MQTRHPWRRILEGVYIADSEDRLRRELEEKGLYILSLQRRARLLRRRSTRRRTPRPYQPPGFLVFQPGAGDAAQGRRRAGPVARHLPCACRTTFKAVLDAIYERSRRGHRFRMRSPNTGRCSRRLRRVADGRRAQRKPRYRHPPVAYEKVIGTVRKRTISTA